MRRGLERYRGKEGEETRACLAVVIVLASALHASKSFTASTSPPPAVRWMGDEPSCQGTEREGEIRGRVSAAGRKE